ncbi:hypothetical protein BDN72DRAFT_767990 [Pluteus cervinus]|uniref:Uncharacterized protein n=1 Tax=Pluteus cervinus TaxID=181527 RepID=A0ACD3AWN0_9AGAR|nr:hypothetical protein BDN72DRAFT_767990 [Pluteus cervinus]
MDGYPFCTLYSIPDSVQRIDRYVPQITLGFRPKDYRPSMVDYTVYEEKRNMVINGPAGRAALKRGGILWRLAMEYFHNAEDAMQALLSKPDLLMSSKGVHYDNKYQDDWLSEEEEQLICGVYKVYNDDKPENSQTSDRSWWPKHVAWEKAGLNMGYWTPDCEAWFQIRCNSI